ncbi:Uracil-regulated protein 1 [Hypoxylon texense]
MAPIINIELSISPSTHCFTRRSAPTISLRLTLFPSPPNSSDTITLYTEDTPLDPRHTLTHAGFTITDLTTQQPVKVTEVHNAQRVANPRLRVHGCFEEPYFVTLRTGDAEELSAEFGRRGFRPHPWSVVQLGREVDDAGNPRSARRSVSVTGVDGLEPGHEYEIGLNTEDLKSIMWAPVAKEDILLEEGYKGPGANLGDYPWIRDQPLDFRVGTTRLKVLEEEEEEASAVVEGENV